MVARDSGVCEHRSNRQCSPGADGQKWRAFFLIFRTSNRRLPKEAHIMDITFTGACTLTTEGVSFQAIVDGKSVPCHVSMQVLQNIDPTNRFSTPRAQFQNNRARIEAAADRKIRAGQLVNGSVYVGTADLLST